MATVNISQEVEELKRRMQGALATLKTEFQGLRTGRATASLVEPVVVEAYGSHMTLKELASVSVPEPRLITVQVWDKSVVQAVDKALRSSGLGINPVVEGQLFRIPIPELNQERRQELVSCWRDTALLGKDLVELVEKVGEAKRTSTLLDGDSS